MFCKEVPLSNDCLAAATPRAIAMSAVIKRRILVTLFLWCDWEQDRIITAIPCSWQLPDFKLKKYFLATICFIFASSLGKQSCWLCSWVSISLLWADPSTQSLLWIAPSWAGLGWGDLKSKVVWIKQNLILHLPPGILSPCQEASQLSSLAMWEQLNTICSRWLTKAGEHASPTAS